MDLKSLRKLKTELSNISFRCLSNIDDFYYLPLQKLWSEMSDKERKRVAKVVRR